MAVFDVGYLVSQMKTYIGIQDLSHVARAYWAAGLEHTTSSEGSGEAWPGHSCCQSQSYTLPHM